MIIDAFTFNTEFDLLEARLEYLNDIVDYFVIVETTATFKGVAKELNFAKNAERYAKYLNKIIYRPYVHQFVNNDLDYKPNGTDYSTAHWEIEMAQRQYITTILGLFNDDDYIIVSDLDEFPSKQGIRTALEHIAKHDALGFQQKMFYYNLKQCQINPWHGSVISTVGYTKKVGAQWLRDHRSSVPFVFDGGWHLSYWMSPEQIQRKIMNFAHQEVNREPFTNLDHIRKRIAAGTDLFDRENPFVPVDAFTLDPEFVSIVSRYEKKHIDHSYMSITGDTSDDNVRFLEYMVARHDEPAVFVDLNPSLGRSSLALATSINNSGKDIRLDCVADWGDEDLRKFNASMKALSHKHRVVRADLIQAASKYRDNSIDFLYIGLLADQSVLDAWLPKVKRTGIVAGKNLNQMMSASSAAGNIYYAFKS